MRVITIKCLNDNFSYIVLNEKNNNACVIDPGEAQPIINKVRSEKINLKFILNTHHHGDHVGGNLELKKEFNCKILGSINDKNNIPGIDITLKNKELYQNEDFEFTTYFTPGHTLGHVVFYFNKQNFYSLVIHFFLLVVVGFLKVHMSKCLIPSILLKNFLTRP